MVSRGDQQCIFVKLGIIAFKVCHSNYNCANCDLAREILDMNPGLKDSPELRRMVQQYRQIISAGITEINGEAKSPCDDKKGIAPSLENYDAPAGLLYHKAHIWILPFSERRARTGFDDFARAILSPITGIKFRNDGRIVWELDCSGRTVLLPYPISGKIVKINDQVVENPCLINTDPFGKGWIMEVKVADWIDPRKFMREEENIQWLRREVDALRRVEEGEFGKVAADGGELLTEPARNLPEDKWKRIVERFIITPAVSESR